MDEQQTTVGNEMETTDAPSQINEVQATEAKSEVESKTYTQEEFDKHMAGLKASLTKKLLKPYEDLGDPEQLRELKKAAEEKQQQEKLKRGEFDQILQDLAKKKDEEISKRDQVIQEFKLEQPLLSIAGEMRSVNPEQVKRLLRNQVRLNEEGEVEVTDNTGKVRYNDSGKTLTVKELVKEFLDQNPHFVQASPSTTNSQHGFKADGAKVDVSKLDMRNPEHRAIYRDYRKKNGIA